MAEQGPGITEKALDFVERFNKVSAIALGSVAVGAAVLGSPEIATTFGILAAADVATGGLVRWFRQKTGKTAAVT